MSASEQAKKVNAAKIERTKKNKAIKAERHALRMLNQSACDTRGAARKLARQHAGVKNNVGKDAIIVETAMRSAFDLDNVKLEHKGNYVQGNVTKSLGIIENSLRSKHGVMKVQGWNAHLSFKTARELNAPMFDSKSPLFKPAYV